MPPRDLSCCQSAARPSIKRRRAGARIATAEGMRGIEFANVIEIMVADESQSVRRAVEPEPVQVRVDAEAGLDRHPELGDRPGPHSAVSRCRPVVPRFGLEVVCSVLDEGQV